MDRSDDREMNLPAGNPTCPRGQERLIRLGDGACYESSVGALAAVLGWSGRAWQIDRFVFWPSIEPIVAFFDGRLAAENRVLDDSLLRYYLHPTLRQGRMTDPFYFRYRDWASEAAYSAAVGDGYFDYIALDGGIGEDARRMRAGILPNLAKRYAVRVKMPEANLGQEIEIYERTDPPPAAPVCMN